MNRFRPSGTLSRRQLLRGATLSAVALGGSGIIQHPARAMPGSSVLIIGSGYAGSVAALRLAQRGVRSTVLERGRRWSIDAVSNTFASSRSLDSRALWAPLGAVPGYGVLPGVTGVLEVVEGTGVKCFAGAGVGGGSLVNYAVMMTPPEHLFRASFGDLLDYEEMVDVWYPRALNLLGCSQIPDDVLASEPYADAREFAKSMARAGLRVERPNLAVDWDVVRAEIAGTIAPSAIMGDCILGINSGAKMSVDRTILAAAEATGLVTVLPMHRVSAVGGDENGYTVECEELSISGSVTNKKVFDSRTVIFAAGSIGTSQMLVRARARGDIAGLPGEVGRYWGTAGDHVTSGLIGVGSPEQQGGPAHLVATDWSNKACPTTFLGFPLGVPVVGPLTKNALAVTVVPPRGSLVHDAVTGDVKVTWPSSDPDIVAVSRGVAQTVSKVDRANERVVPTISSPAVTSHALGGAIIGKVTDGFGQVIGCPGLFVVDGALIHGSTGAVPPALTVTALADRCASRIASQLSGE